jgi:hypothetical protein
VWEINEGRHSPNPSNQRQGLSGLSLLLFAYRAEELEVSLVQNYNFNGPATSMDMALWGVQWLKNLFALLFRAPALLLFYEGISGILIGRIPS